ncbi:MAG: peptidylprolyl isomerase, partial [Pseudonocardiales bacterium]|nr:peptidylprolyl isomerase [Pseudonocardiales bacterium]
VVLTVPPSLGYGTGGNKSAHISGTDTLVFVVDIARAYNLRSTADPAATVQPAPLSAPTVRGALTAAPTISILKALKPPTARATYLLARGTGRAVIKGTVVAQYVAVDWTGGIQQSTWQNGTATSVPVGDAQSLTGGLFDGLVGLPIGSRVLITAPAPPGQDKRRNSVAVVLDIVDEVTTAKST